MTPYAQKKYNRSKSTAVTGTMTISSVADTLEFDIDKDAVSQFVITPKPNWICSSQRTVKLLPVTLVHGWLLAKSLDLKQLGLKKTIYVYQMMIY